MAQINKPNQYFNTVLYTGTGSELAITGVGFQPDWTWIKRRDAVANGGMFDNVRGATKLLSSSQTDGEQTLAQSLKSFDSDGFTLGTGINGYVNTSGSTTVSWNWLASNTTASNTDGSITSTVSANTTSGFSIVSYTGTGANATVGHGLSSAPKVVITKNRDGIGNWEVYHGSISGMSGGFIELNQTTAFTGGSYGVWNGDPDSSTFGIGTNVASNTSGANYIAYCFAEKQGFSKFGSYVGNGNADGTFVYTGFKPAFFMLKNIDAAESWTIRDTKRSPYNVGTIDIFPNLPNAETTSGGGNFYDILSNGVKLRGADARQNQSGQNYIYMAFAENPLVGTNNIPATAR